MSWKKSLDVKAESRELLRASKNTLKWKWDERLFTALAEFSVDDIDTVRKILKPFFSFTYISFP